MAIQPLRRRTSSRAKGGGAHLHKTLRKKQTAFLAAYAECGVISAAADIAGCSRESHYYWSDDPDYRKAFAEAERQANEALEKEAHRRACLGYLEPVYQMGKKVGVKRKFSDTLLIFTMKGRMPDKYRERTSIEHSGPGGGPIPLVEAVVRTRAEAADILPRLQAANGNGRLTNGTAH